MFGAACRSHNLVTNTTITTTTTDNNDIVDKRNSTNGGRGSEPLSLLELCVRSICRRLGDFREFPSFLPREVVDALLDSLTQVRLVPRLMMCFLPCGSLADCVATGSDTTLRIDYTPVALSMFSVVSEEPLFLCSALCSAGL